MAAAMLLLRSLAPLPATAAPALPARSALHTSASLFFRRRGKPNRHATEDVVLRAPMPRLGGVGEVAAVQRGYARNHLVPAGLAVYATPLNRQVYGAAAEAEAKKKAAAAVAAAASLSGPSAADVHAQAHKVARYLKNHPLVIRRQRGNKWVVSRDLIVESAKSQLNLAIPADRLQMDPAKEHKSFGRFEYPVVLADGVQGNLRVHIVPR